MQGNSGFLNAMSVLPERYKLKRRIEYITLSVLLNSGMQYDIKLNKGIEDLQALITKPLTSYVMVLEGLDIPFDLKFAADGMSGQVIFLNVHRPGHVIDPRKGRYGDKKVPIFSRIELSYDEGPGIVERQKGMHFADRVKAEIFNTTVMKVKANPAAAFVLSDCKKKKKSKKHT